MASPLPADSWKPIALGVATSRACIWARLELVVWSLTRRLGAGLSDSGGQLLLADLRRVNTRGLCPKISDS